MKSKLTENARFTSRYAPTPSGYLHMGNIFNFLLIQKITRERNGEIILRIDDLDSTRIREEYLIDIFEILDWLGLTYDKGPKDINDFNQNYSQVRKKEYYFEKLKVIENTFICNCSRSMIKKVSSDGIYPGTCYSKNLIYSPMSNQIRYKYESCDELKDFVIWRKDNIPSYQLVSVVEDIENKVNLIIRGEDLKSSSHAQIKLSKHFDSDFSKETEFIHHPLMKDLDGNKLSKSQNSPSIKLLKKIDKSPDKIIDAFNEWYELIKDSIL